MGGEGHGGGGSRTGQRCFSQCSTPCLELDRGHFRTKFHSALPLVAAQTCVEDMDTVAADCTGTYQQQVHRKVSTAVSSGNCIAYPPWLIGVVEALNPLLRTIPAASTQFIVGGGGAGRGNNLNAPRTSM